MSFDYISISKFPTCSFIFKEKKSNLLEALVLDGQSLDKYKCTIVVVLFERLISEGIRSTLSVSPYNVAGERRVSRQHTLGVFG